MIRVRCKACGGEYELREGPKNDAPHSCPLIYQEEEGRYKERPGHRDERLDRSAGIRIGRIRKEGKGYEIL
jgi:rubredoxin